MEPTIITENPNIINVPGLFKGIQYKTPLAKANQLYDDDLENYQSTINAELFNAIAGGSGSSILLIDYSLIDTLTNPDGNSTVYQVTESDHNAGILFLIGDNMGHVATLILYTHYIFHDLAVGTYRVGVRSNSQSSTDEQIISGYAYLPNEAEKYPTELYIWEDSQNPISNSIITNYSGCDIFVIDSTTTVDGEFRSYKIESGDSWQTEWPVDKIKACGVIGEGTLDTSSHSDKNVVLLHRTYSISSQNIPENTWTNWKVFNSDYFLAINYTLSTKVEPPYVLTLAASITNNIVSTTVDPRITLLENELAQYINGGTTVSLKATPTSIFSNADNNGTNVTLRATASKDASVTITKGGNTIHTAASTQDTSYTDQNVSLAGGQLASYTATFEIGTGTAMVTKTATATVKAYDKIYYGIGTANDHSTVTTDQSVRTSAAGTYDFTITAQDITQGKNYVYILVPTSMSNGNIGTLDQNNVVIVTLASGLGTYNLLLLNTEVKNGVTYKVYRSLEDNSESVTLKL